MIAIRGGKDKFIRDMAADTLGKIPAHVTEAQFKVAKALFLAMAYNALPSVVSKLTADLRAA